jgi:uncharacterized protein YjbI with pentapeptide repeats
VLRFLRESGLIYKGKEIVDLREADLSDADLSNIKLSGANLSGADLSNANLNGANLKGATYTMEQLRQAQPYSNQRIS